MSDMLDIKEKCDPKMCNSDAYRRTKSTLQEHNGVDSQNNLLERIYVTPRFYGDSGIRYIKDNELNPSFVSEQNCYGKMSTCRLIFSSITEIGRYFLP